MENVHESSFSFNRDRRVFRSQFDVCDTAATYKTSTEHLVRHHGLGLLPDGHIVGGLVLVHPDRMLSKQILVLWGADTSIGTCFMGRTEAEKKRVNKIVIPI